MIFGIVDQLLLGHRHGVYPKGARLLGTDVSIESSSVGGEIGTIGLVSGIANPVLSLGDKEMEDTYSEAGGGDSSLEQAVLAAGTFDRDETIADLIGSKSSVNPTGRG